MINLKSFNRYIKSNTLHKDYYKETNRLQTLVIKHTKHYRDNLIEVEQYSSELVNEISYFEKYNYNLPDCLLYYGYIKELTQLAKKLNDTQYLKSIETLSLCCELFKAYIQIEIRNKIINQRLEYINNPRQNVNYNKVISEYLKAEDKDEYTRITKYSNITPYSYSELRAIKDITKITSRTNMLFDEIFITDDLMEQYELLGRETQELNRLLQEVIILNNEADELLTQLLEHTLRLIDIQQVSPNSLELVTLAQDLFNQIEKKNPEYVLRLAYIKRLIYDTAFIVDSNTILDDSLKANNAIIDFNKSLSDSIEILSEFKRQKESVIVGDLNDQNSYILDYPNTIANTGNTREPIALTYNQHKAIKREKSNKAHSSIEASITEWAKNDPLGIDKLDKDLLRNTPGSYKYLADTYRDTSSEFDEMFSDKVFASIGAAVAVYNTNLSVVQQTIDTAINLIQAIIKAGVSIAQAVLDAMLNILNEVKCLIKAVACAIAQIASTIKDALGYVKPVIKSLDQLNNMTSGLKTLPGAAIEAAKDYAKKATQEIMNLVSDKLNETYENIKNTMGEDIAEKFKEGAHNAKHNCEHKVSNKLFDNMLEKAESIFNEVMDIKGNSDLIAKGGSECPSLLGNLNLGIQLGSLRTKRLQIPNLNGRLGGC